MADRFDTLSQKFIERLEERRLSSGPECLSVSKLESYRAVTSVAEAAETYLKPPHLACLSVGQLESYLAGKLISEERRAVEVHLDGCLACLYAKVQLEDLLDGIAAPTALEPALRKRLWRGIRRSAASGPFLPDPRRLWRAILEALEWRAFVRWGLAGALAGVILSVAVVNVIQEQAEVVAPPAIILRGIPQGETEPHSIPEDRSWGISSPTWLVLAAWALAGASAGIALKMAVNITRRRSTRSSAS